MGWCLPQSGLADLFQIPCIYYAKSELLIKFYGHKFCFYRTYHNYFDWAFILYFPGNFIFGGYIFSDD